MCLKNRWGTFKAIFIKQDSTVNLLLCLFFQLHTHSIEVSLTNTRGVPVDMWNSLSTTYSLRPVAETSIRGVIDLHHIFTAAWGFVNCRNISDTSSKAGNDLRAVQRTRTQNFQKSRRSIWLDEEVWFSKFMVFLYLVPVFSLPLSPMKLNHAGIYLLRALQHIQR